MKARGMKCSAFDVHSVKHRFGDIRIFYTRVFVEMEFLCNIFLLLGHFIKKERNVGV